MVYKYLLLYLYHRTAWLFHISSPHLQHNESNTNLFTHTTAAWNFLVRILQLYFNGACLASNTATAAILFYSYLQSGKITSSPSTYWILRYSTLLIKKHLNNLKYFELNITNFQMLRVQEMYQNKIPHVLFEWKQIASTKTYWEDHTNVKRLEFCIKRFHKMGLIKLSPT